MTEEEKIAIEFAEWIEQNYYHCDEHRWLKAGVNPPIYHSTEEAFEEFKKERK